MSERAGTNWQADYWNGEAGKRWAIHQEQVDRALSPFGRAMVEAAELTSGQHVLDVGCGCGDTSLVAAEQVLPHGTVTGVDVSAPMIERARARAAGEPRLRFVCDDAAHHAFSQQFDALISRYGLMFFADPVGALRRLRAQLTPTGRASFVAWRSLAENEWLSFPLRVVCESLNIPEPRAPSGPSPFAFADKDYVSGLLADAGYGRVQVQPLRAPVRMSEAGLEEAVRFVQLHAGPVGRLLSEVDDDARRRALTALERALAPRVRGSILELNGSAWLFTATA